MFVRQKGHNYVIYPIKSDIFYLFPTPIMHSVIFQQVKDGGGGGGITIVVKSPRPHSKY